MVLFFFFLFNGQTYI